MTDKHTKKLPLVILAGPTAIGKTALSVKLAKAINGEIISADSMQVYRHMDIGSAKISKEEMQGVPHHLIDCLNPTDEFNVTIFVSMAKKAIQTIIHNGHIPILVGGTGFYIQALLYDIDFAEEDNKTIRLKLESFYQNNGEDALFSLLKECDPKSAEIIDKHNIKRVIRAIEYFRIHGETISGHNEAQRQKESAYNSAFFVLTDERSHLYERIDQRVDLMMENGLLDEVKELSQMGLNRTCQSMQGLGYKEILDYLDGKISLEEAVYIIKRDTRHFAKRQLTWFKREKEVIWIPKAEYQYKDEYICEYMLKILKEKQIYE
ncbi:MAG: tRNA (adenosine(37)-N6)-dimethylallyltransferase MiaA [Lachnospiraceae bacterium]|nr:tRNA (adenosine(37)-N6)-dimethylallyltransferase MiaA [Lachnospiraceae bacterium]